MMRALFAVSLLAGCDLPRVETLGSVNPICIVICTSVTSVADSEGEGNVSETTDVTESIGTP